MGPARPSTEARSVGGPSSRRSGSGPVGEGRTQEVCSRPRGPASPPWSRDGGEGLLFPSCPRESSPVVSSPRASPSLPILVVARTTVQGPRRVDRVDSGLLSVPPFCGWVDRYRLGGTWVRVRLPALLSVPRLRYTPVYCEVSRGLGRSLYPRCRARPPSLPRRVTGSLNDHL